MLEFIIGKLIAAPVIGTFLKSISTIVLTWQKQKLDAEGTLEAHEDTIAQRTLALDQREDELNAGVVVAEQGHWITRNVRPALAIPVIVIMAKLLIWDKALGTWTHGHTDPLDLNMWHYIDCVVVSYMGGRSIEKVGSVVASVFKK